jgi:nickel-dependent lactate racemase
MDAWTPSTDLPAISRIAPTGSYLSADDVRQLVSDAAPHAEHRGKKILLIVPDATRTAPVDLFFRALHEQLGTVAAAFDVMVALGTHPPMSDAAICHRLGITLDEKQARYPRVKLLNHEWDNPAALRSLGVIPADEIHALSSGLFSMDVEVKINRLLFDYDKIIIVGPVFPHEVVGFSGGNKYLFPGVSGPEVLNFFHWLGAVVTNPQIIGNKWTPVRKVVDRAGSMVKLDKLCFAMVVDHNQLAGAFAGTPESAWDAASELSRKLHITYVDKPFHTVLSCAPRMYDDLWTGGKCMYKLEPVVADGGELIIYAPHITEVSVTHGPLIEQIGYHCRDYFLKQWDRFKHVPWGVLAHSTHVRGVGTYDNGQERCRIKVTVASRISPEICRKINLGYRDPDSIRMEDFANQQDQGVMLVPKAGEMLYHLKNPPPWAKPS